MEVGFGSGPSVVLLSVNVWVARTLEETQLLHLHLCVGSGLMLPLNAVTPKATRCGAAPVHVAFLAVLAVAQLCAIILLR